MAAPKGYSILSFLISWVLTFGVNHQDLVVGENVATKGYTIPVINNLSSLHLKVQITLTENIWKKDIG